MDLFNQFLILNCITNSPIEGMIGSFDCAINLTEYDKAGCYIDEEMFRGFN